MPRTATGVIILGLSALATFVIGAALYQLVRPYLPAFIQQKVGV
jgi:hypothetical protein